jgi:uncharacterized protein (TIGR02284 family)
MNNEKTIDVLNSLIIINHDRIEGYETASKETEEEDLKALFSQFAQRSEQCSDELVEEVEELDGVPAEGTRTIGKFFRVWMDLKAALTGKDRKAILNSCEYGEDVALNAYEKALKDNANYLTIEQQAMIGAQHRMIKADHDKVKAMRDMLIEA